MPACNCNDMADKNSCTKIKVKAKEPIYYNLVLYKEGDEFWIDNVGHFSSSSMIPLQKTEAEVLQEKRGFYDIHTCEYCGKQCKGYLSFRTHQKRCRFKPIEDDLQSEYQKYQSYNAEYEQELEAIKTNGGDNDIQ